MFSIKVFEYNCDKNFANFDKTCMLDNFISDQKENIILFFIHKYMYRFLSLQPK